MITVKIPATILLLCCALALSAQPVLPGKVSARLPALLDGDGTPSMTQLRRVLSNGSGWGQEKSVQKLWVAYSDRNANPTFTSADRTTRYGELKFGEKVCIAEIRGDMAHVYADDKARYPAIPSGIKSKGWVPMENLLLWRKCPKGSLDTQRKVISSINLDWMPKDGKIRSEKYDAPDGQGNGSPMGTDLNLYYVMKETDDGEYVLLSSSSSLMSAQSLHGWVNRNDITDFSQHVFLEPEWDTFLVEEYKGRKAYIYDDEEGHAAIAHWEFGTSANDSAGASKYRMDRTRLRFPVQSRPDANGMVKCLCFLNPGSFYESFLKERVGLKAYQELKETKHAFCSYNVYVKRELGWRYVLCFSSDELKELIETLSPIYEATEREAANSRRAFVDALLAVVSDHLGESSRASGNDLEKMSLWQILYILYDIGMIDKGQSEYYDCALKDITNKKKVSDNDYLVILGRFKNRYNGLRSFVQSYDFRIDIGGMYYYWIPLEDMP